MSDSGTIFLDSLIMEQSTPAVATVVNEGISFSGDRVKKYTPAGQELVEQEHLRAKLGRRIVEQLIQNNSPAANSKQ